MHHTLPLLRTAWALVMIVYCAVGFAGILRLRGAAAKRNLSILAVMAVLVVIRVAVLRVFGGLAYWVAVIIVGTAAGIAAVIVAKMLIAQNSSDEAVRELGPN